MLNDNNQRWAIMKETIIISPNEISRREEVLEYGESASELLDKYMNKNTSHTFEDTATTVAINYGITPTDMMKSTFPGYMEHCKRLEELQEKKEDITNTTDSDYIDVTSLKVGDEVIVPHDEYGDIEFICIGKDHDGEGTATLLTKYIIDQLAFDAREPYSNDYYIQMYGNNRYSVSNLLCWMNSNADYKDWFVPHHNHTTDQAPDSENVVTRNPYTKRPGLLHGFSDAFKQQLVPVYKKTAKNKPLYNGEMEDVLSNVFLLSRTEIGHGNEDCHEEGKVYEYFSNDDRYDRKIAYQVSSDTTIPRQWWLRTPYSFGSSDVRIVGTDGRLKCAESYNGRGGLRFAVVIKNK